MWHFEDTKNCGVHASLTVRPANGKWVVVVAFSVEQPDGNYGPAGRYAETTPYESEGDAWETGRKNLLMLGFQQIM